MRQPTHFLATPMKQRWSTYCAAPHRGVFLTGALQAVLVLLWWMLDREGRGLGGTGLGSLPGVALHAWWLIYGFFPFFIFGFLFTAMPNWLDSPPISRRAYVASGLLMALGVLLVYTPLAPVGLALHLAGWSVAVAALAQNLIAAPKQDKRHAGIVTFAAALGGIGDALFLAWAVADYGDAFRLVLALGIWGFLMPLFLAVCHRMLPWFSSLVIPSYVLIRPYGPLWGLLLACLAHGSFEAAGLRAWLWLVDIPMALVIFWFASRWGVLRGVRQERLLAMLHIAFLWVGPAMLLYAADSLSLFFGLAWGAGLAPLHALSIGFFTSLLLAMASRVSLGHSGRKLVADRVTWWLFWLLQAVACLRMASDLLPAEQSLFIRSAGGLWLLTFAWWAWKYAPMYWRPRADGKAG